MSSLVCTETNEPLVSVLTPVYNGERYLASCIESVLSQTYRNWEYIIVNNCSTDKTLEIATHYAQQEPRIRIVNNEEFVGAIKNHNIAVTLISRSSKYCKFVQADDVIFPTCLTEMVRVAEANPSVGIVSSYQLQGRWVCCDGIPYPSPVIPGREACRMFFLKKRRVFGTLSAFLVRADIAGKHTPFLNEKYLFCDWDAFFRILQEYDQGFVHQVLSMWRRHDEALSSFPERHNAWTIAELYFIKKYGPFYLTPQEYKRCVKQAVDNYYRRQGHEIFHLREKSFWQYHRTMMEEIGFSFSPLHLLEGAVREIFDLLLGPIKGMGRSMNYIRTGQARFRPNSESSEK